MVGEISMALEVLIAGEDRFWVDAIGHQLNLTDDLQVSDRVSSREELLAQVKYCDVVAIHHGLGLETTLETLNQLLDVSSEIAVVVVGVPNSPETIVKYLETGARGYVRACDGIEHLVEVLRGIPERRTVIGADIAALIATRLSELRDLADDLMPSVPSAAALTAREQEILECIARGESNQEIADNLFIAVGTVKNHVHNILHKLNVRDRRQAAALMVLPAANDTVGRDGAEDEALEPPAIMPTPIGQIPEAEEPCRDARTTP